MRFYVTNPAGELYKQKVQNMNLGIVRLANCWQLPWKDVPWFADNGAFHAYSQGLEFNDEQFLSMLKKIDCYEQCPDFIVCPDLVAQGYKSLDFSLKWINKIPSQYSVYLAVQDGMEPNIIKEHMTEFAGIFVGGSIEWKIDTLPQWARACRENNYPLHIGRCGNLKKMLHAKKWFENYNLKKKSIDSCNWCRNNTWHDITAVRQQSFLSDFQEELI